MPERPERRFAKRSRRSPHDSARRSNGASSPKKRWPRSPYKWRCLRWRCGWRRLAPASAWRTTAIFVGSCWETLSMDERHDPEQLPRRLTAVTDLIAEAEGGSDDWLAPE